MRVLSACAARDISDPIFFLGESVNEFRFTHIELNLSSTDSEMVTF